MRTLRNIFLTFFSVVITLTIAEVLFRYFDPLHLSEVSKENAQDLNTQLQQSEEINPDLQRDVKMSALIKKSPYPDIVYQLKPNIAGLFLGKKFKFNSQGLRDKEYSAEKPANTFRIVGLGDSVMFGWGAEDNENYLSLIEEKLNKEKPSKNFEVLNFAVPGYNTAMEVATYLHRASKYSPDLIIMHFVDNDLEVPLFMEDHSKKGFLDKLYLYQLVKKSIDNLAGKDGGDLIGLEGDIKNMDRPAKWKVLNEYKYMVGGDGYKNAMEKLFHAVKLDSEKLEGEKVNSEKTSSPGFSQKSAQQSIPVIIILGASPKSSFPKDAAKNFGFEILEIKPFVDKYFEDTKQENTKANRKKLFWVTNTDPHPSPLAHKIFAEAIISKIKLMQISSLN